MGSIGAIGLALPAVAAIAGKVRVRTAGELTDRLLPAVPNLEDASFDPGINYAVMGGGGPDCGGPAC